VYHTCGKTAVLEVLIASSFFYANGQMVIGVVQWQV
jgi:hypothetical protein